MVLVPQVPLPSPWAVSLYWRDRSKGLIGLCGDYIHVDVFGGVASSLFAYGDLNESGDNIITATLQLRTL